MSLFSCVHVPSVLSARELRTLLTHTEGIPITLDSINTFKWTLGNCSKSFNGTRPQVSKEDMENLYDPGFVSLPYDIN